MALHVPKDQEIFSLNPVSVFLRVLEFEHCNAVICNLISMAGFDLTTLNSANRDDTTGQHGQGML
jgi:hypothetical protein